MRSAWMKTLPLCVLAFCLPGVAQTAHLRKTNPDLTVQRWYGNAIDYSGYRVGQNPDLKVYPSQAQVLEDLTILRKNWKLVLLYGGDQHSQDVLKVIQKQKLGIKVVLGFWLSGKPGFETKNADQVATAIRLANQYKKIVIAVNVGNEALVSWSDHQLTEDKAIEYVEQVRNAVRCPVTVADDFLYWRQPEAKLTGHVDFILLHTYPMWNREDIDTAMSSTIKNYEIVRKAHPGKTIVIGEAGWASYSVGDKHAPRAGDEVKQKRYYEELNAWAKANNVTTFYFEAFDEPWKGSGTEAHWGLFSVDRKAKLAMQGLYPELMPSGPTSPSYDMQASGGK